MYTSLAADVHTPVSSLNKLEKESYTFYLNQLKGKSKRKIFCYGLKPDLIWECRNNNCKVTDKTLKKIIMKIIFHLNSLRNLIKSNKLKIPNQIPSISSGLFGYMGYEMIQYFEKVILSKKIILNYQTLYLLDLQ